MSSFGPGALARKELIDAIVPDRPVFLSSRDGHTGWANSVALNMAGITKDTPDPADGRIDRDPENGEPIGALQEGAQKLVRSHIPETSDEERIAGLLYSVKMLNEYGITSIQDASVDEEALKTYSRSTIAGKLSLRVVGSIWWDRDRDSDRSRLCIKRLRNKYTPDRIDVKTVKIMQDGVMENYTAVLLEPYNSGQSTRAAYPMVEPELLKQVVARLDAEGFQVHFHAIGDGPMRQSLDAVEEARCRTAGLGTAIIFRISSCSTRPISRDSRNSSVVANFQPLWAYADAYITDLTIPFIGEETGALALPDQDDAGLGAAPSSLSAATGRCRRRIRITRWKQR